MIINFDEIKLNEAKQTYQVMNNNECIFESKNVNECVIVQATINLYGLAYFKSHRDIVKRSYINDIELPKEIHWQPSQNRYILIINNKQIYGSKNYSEVEKMNEYVKVHGVEEALKNKWSIVEKKRPGSRKGQKYKKRSS